MASNEGEENVAGPEGENEGEAKMLVSEFPPPPFYYKAAAHLTPPEIPYEALARGTKRAAANAARAVAESERLRMGEDDPDKTGAILGGVPAPEEEEEGDVVAVFGEVVEDPIVEALEPCERPTVIRDEVKRLNKEVVKGFVKLVQELVHRPSENKKMRDDLSHNTFMMLLECNKFREHQAREFLIELLEQQLAERKALIAELQKSTARVDELLGDREKKATEKSDEASTAKA